MAYHNKAVTYDLFLKASSQTMRTIAADPKRLGRNPTAAQCVRVQRFSAASCHQRRAAPVSSGHWA